MPLRMECQKTLTTTLTIVGFQKRESSWCNVWMKDRSTTEGAWKERRKRADFSALSDLWANATAPPTSGIQKH